LPELIFLTLTPTSLSTHSGASLAPDARRPGTQPNRGALVVVANSKTCLGCTKRGTRRRATRVSGFRARTQTPTGRAVLKARRKKGRKVLCTKSLYKK
jgi:large subunit ribosomal protein L34